MTNPKKIYKTPETIVVEVNAEGVICWSDPMVTWFLTDPYHIQINNVDAEWGRGGYGTADEL